VNPIEFTNNDEDLGICRSNATSSGENERLQ
jgi:hypothetical protein